MCGGRKLINRQKVHQILDNLHNEHNFKFMITGGATGADSHAARWAFIHGMAHAIFPACWDLYGPSAGPIRNKWMLKFGEPDMVVAFPGGVGTENMVKLALDAGITVFELDKF